MSDWLDTFWAIYSNLVLTIGINALLALSIWLTLSCGLLAMANAAFMGLGAYTASLLTINAGAPFPVAVLAGVALPTVVAPKIAVRNIASPRARTQSDKASWADT